MPAWYSCNNLLIIQIQNSIRKECYCEIPHRKLVIIQMWLTSLSWPRFQHTMADYRPRFAINSENIFCWKWKQTLRPLAQYRVPANSQNEYMTVHSGWQVCCQNQCLEVRRNKFYKKHNRQNKSMRFKNNQLKTNGLLLQHFTFYRNQLKLFYLW